MWRTFIRRFSFRYITHFLSPVIMRDKKHGNTGRDACLSLSCTIRIYFLVAFVWCWIQRSNFVVQSSNWSSPADRAVNTKDGDRWDTVLQSIDLPVRDNYLLNFTLFMTFKHLWSMIVWIRMVAAMILDPGIHLWNLAKPLKISARMVGYIRIFKMTHKLFELYQNY